MELRKTYTVPYPSEQTYRTWVSSDTVIAPATAMDIKPVVGGHYRLLMEGAEFVGRNEGKFLSVTPGQHVRYTWEWNNDGEVSEIDVTFSAVPDGTRIDIVHSGFQSEESRQNHDSGWDNYIQGFVKFLAGQS